MTITNEDLVNGISGVIGIFPNQRSVMIAECGTVDPECNQALVRLIDNAGF